MRSESSSAFAAPPSRSARAASDTPAAANCYALNFESGLGPIAELDRQLERTAVARSGHRTVAADQRTIRKKMMREMRRTQIVLALRIGERFTRHRLDDLQLAQRDQHLHEPHPRPTDERPLPH